MIYLFAFLIVPLAGCMAQKNADGGEYWQSMFNGKNLDGWIVKIRGYDVGENFGNTFRVRDGHLVVDYSAYDNFDDRFGHIFYNTPYSYYRLRLQYRFIGDQMKGGADWAYRNSGIMIHGQPAESMGRDQDFPMSIEVQLLGGKGDGQDRPTCNLCTPGTNVTYDGHFETQHCINSTSQTFDGDQWVTAEVEVYGDSLIRHYVNDTLVMTYRNPVIGGGAISNYDAAIYKEGQPLSSGTISLQSESHPVEFRNIEIMNLEGCMDPNAKNYRSYYVKENNQECVY